MHTFGTSLTGFDHYVVYENNQDAYFLAPKFGVIADGCGGGNHSESGSWDAVYFVGHSLERIINETKNPYDLSQKVSTQLLDYFKVRQSHHSMDPAAYRSHFLLFTLGFFVIHQDKLIVGLNGDFCVRLNDWSTFNSHDNTPPYLSYNLNPKYPDEYLVNCQLSTWVIPLDSVKVLALATDGWSPHLDKLHLIEQHLNPKARNISDGLFRQMIGWSETDQCFTDDATVIGVLA
jgi:hypothetical protein